jgi:HCOMODA/2-hydroxy-3-carboxy-muconic semialdehyde decarboxylase
MHLGSGKGELTLIPVPEAERQELRVLRGLRAEIAEAANVLARLGLVTAYGHVSARAGAAMLITPAADLAGVTGSSVLEVPLGVADGDALPAGVPAEAWAHLALYQARPDAAAIARAQPASAFAAAAAAGTVRAATAAGAAGAAGSGGLEGVIGSRALLGLVPLHGQAAWLGESIPVHDGATLLRSPEQARSAARSLPAGEALLLRGNGALTLGATPGIAVARMWLLSAACDVYLAASAAAGPDGVIALSGDEIASWRAVRDELLPRLWQHLRRPG